jgi:predicted esterase
MQRSRWQRAFFFASFGALVVLGGPAALYLIVAETTQTRILAAGFVALLSVAPLVLFDAQRIGAAVFACGTLAMLLGFRLAPATPLADIQVSAASGSAAPGGRIAAQAISRFTAAYPYPRFSVANVVPELDQIKFGTYLVPAADPLITTSDARRLRDSAMTVYRAAEADPQFNQLGSAMHYAYRDADSGHIYAYSPERAAGEKLPVLLFLHGSGGNFKVYTHMLKAVADKNHMLLVSPSFGFGNWHEAGGTAAIERARLFAIQELGGDAGRVVLVGLSNGGRGVTRAIAEHGEAYAGVFFLSAVVEPVVLRQAGFAAQIRGKCTAFAYGALDDRIPVEYTEKAITMVRAAGGNVHTHAYAERDHFLFFTESRAVLDDIGNFVNVALAGCTLDENAGKQWHR